MDPKAIPEKLIHLSLAHNPQDDPKALEQWKYIRSGFIRQFIPLL